MMDVTSVMDAARQDAPPASWRVWRGQKGFFIRQAVIGAILVVAAVAGVVYLLSNPDIAIVLGTYGSDTSTPVDPGLFMILRAADYLVVALFGALGAYTLIRRASEAAGASQQVLALLPEGVVFAGGARPRAFAFASVRSVSATRSRGTVRLTFTPMAGKKSSLVLDGRFGQPKPIAQAIMSAHRQFYTGEQR